MPRRKGTPDEPNSSARRRHKQREASRKAREAFTADSPSPVGELGSGENITPEVNTKGGRGKWLVPAAVGTAAVGGGAYLWHRQRQKQALAKRWVGPDGRDMVVLKYDKSDPDKAHRRAMSITSLATPSSLASGIAYNVGHKGGRDRGELSTNEKRKVTAGIMGGFGALSGGANLRASVPGAVILGGPTAYLYHRGRKRGAEHGKPIKKGMAMGQLVLIKKNVSKSAMTTAVTNVRSVAVPSLTGGRYAAGNANKLGRHHGKKLVPSRTQLVQIKGKRASGRGSRILQVKG